MSQRIGTVCDFAIQGESIRRCLRGCFTGVSVSIKQFPW